MQQLKPSAVRWEALTQGILAPFTGCGSVASIDLQRRYNANYRRHGWRTSRRLFFRRLQARQKWARQFPGARARADAGEGKTPGVFRRGRVRLAARSEGEWQFRVQSIRYSPRNVRMLAKHLRNLQLQDAIDWLCAIPKARLHPFFTALSDARDRIALEFGGDPARLYFNWLRIETRPGIPWMMKFKNYWHTIRTYNNTVVFSVRQLSMDDYFSRIFMENKVPRSIALDMRLAISEKRAPPEMLQEWQPYLTAHSRRLHRQKLHWLQKRGELQYASLRQQWIAKYEQNLLNLENDKRRQRNLEPLLRMPLRTHLKLENLPGGETIAAD